MEKDLLLHWEEAVTKSPMVMSGKGEPLAKMARPLVASCAWAAVHSEREVGLERGKMIGGLGFSFIASRISWLKRPPQADRPGYNLLLRVDWKITEKGAHLSGC